MDAAIETPTKGPLGPERWSGAIDNVGGPSLGNLLASLCYWGSCASVGNAAGVKFEATVIPFLLRGINLLGIDSVTCPMDRRAAAWGRIARDLPLDKLDQMSREVSLEEVPTEAERILKGQIRGRTVIDVSA